MILICSADQRQHEFRDGKLLVLSFGWNRERYEYLTDDNRSLGKIWGPAHVKAQAMAEARMRKAAK